MTTVNAKQLRANLRHYLDSLERGEEITIIRNSIIIGTIMPAFPAPKKGAEEPFNIGDDKEVIFRQYQPEDREAVKELHETALKDTGTWEDTGIWRDVDLDNIEGAYMNMVGDFIVGLMDEEIVAMGAFRLGADGAELKRMRVRPDLQGRGIGSRVLTLLEERAKQQGYKTMVLDTVNQTTAQKLYESRGYQETGRQTKNGLELVFYRKEL